MGSDGYNSVMKYVALLRGIMPSNPNMHNDKLRGVFEELGFENVKSVVSSGNIIFETKQTENGKLETRIEKSLKENLGFESSTVVRSESELRRIADSHPFSSTPDTPKSRLNITFLKSHPKSMISLPHRAEDNSFRAFKIDNITIGSVINTTTTKTPIIMSWLEQNFGKQITTRTNKTLLRILDKF